MRTLIIGGGLSGLALAEKLEAKGAEYLLLEARARFGGRIKTEHCGGAAFDMGPAWFWPGQPRIAALIERFGLTRFDQYAQGELTFEDERGHVQRGRGFASMEGSWRLRGGLVALTDALAMRVPQQRKRFDAEVTRITHTPQGVAVTLASAEVLEADQLVLAMPPRIAAELSFDPDLADATRQTMRGIATWMAGQAKAVAVYDTPFWRAAGLSGDAMSRRGPMVEIHDASPFSEGPYALFGFIGTPPAARKDTPALRQDITSQLTRLFGPKAATPRALYVKDWAFDPCTATQADHAPLYAHPTYGLPPALRDLWDGRLHFAGTEVAPEFGGYLEGALEAAENVALALR
ncbi:MAG: flavin monoamine oxidase family protein [Sulfitobacter sp.]